MKELKLYRKRLIPEELILLKGDLIVSADEEKIVTKWNTLHPRHDFSYGVSCYYLNLGIKVSKFFKEDDSLLYWYCDIVDYEWTDETTLVVTDLLADVVIFPDGKLRVVDLDELAEAFEQSLLPAEKLTQCLRQLNNLLSVIYRDEFSALQKDLDV